MGDVMNLGSISRDFSGSKGWQSRLNVAGQLWGLLQPDVREPTRNRLRIIPIFCEYRVRFEALGRQFGSVSGHHNFIFRINKLRGNHSKYHRE